jgi:hypothetical protein
MNGQYQFQNCPESFPASEFFQSAEFLSGIEIFSNLNNLLKITGTIIFPKCPKKFQHPGKKVLRNPPKCTFLGSIEKKFLCFSKLPKFF